MLRCLSTGFLSREAGGCGGDEGVGADAGLCLETASEEDVLWLPLTRSLTFCLRTCRRFAFIALDWELERELALERLERLLELEYELELELVVDDDEENDDPEE